MLTPRIDSSSRALRGLLAVCVLLVVVVGWGIVESRLSAGRFAAVTSSNLATALARDIERTIESFDLSLRAARQGLTAPVFPQLDPVSRQILLFDGSTNASDLGAVLVTNSDGEVLYDSTTTSPRKKNLSDRDYFDVHRARTDPGLYFGKPYRSSSTGDWSIALSRRIDGLDGSFAGVVAGSIRYSFFRKLFATLDLGPDSTITVLTTDGVVVYRTGDDDSDIGRDFRPPILFEHLREGRTAPYEARSPLDGRQRLIAFARVGNYPLILTVNTASSTVYADWYRKAAVAACLSLVLIVVGSLLVRMLFEQQRRREQAERAVLRSSRMFRAYFENAADALFLIEIDANGAFRIGQINPACARLTGIGKDAALGKRLGDLFEADIASQVEQRYRACLEAAGPYGYTETRSLRTGTHDLHTVLSVIRDADGAPAMILGSSRDMTEQNKLLAKQHQANKMETVGRLTAGLAHDFNNYLQTIVSSLDVIAAEGLAGNEAAEIGQIAHDAASGAGRLVHHLLAFSGQQVLRPRRLSVPTLFGEACQLVGRTVLGPGLHPAVIIEAFTRDVVVDSGQAQSCLLNLLMNARDAMPEGGSLVLHARNAGPDDVRFGALPGADHVILAVEDTGTGMDDETVARAFEPFFTTKTFGQGAGLGLSMAQGFCQQSGGDIRIISDPTGTRVELWLPAATDDLRAAGEREANLATMGRDSARVLLVQDDPEDMAALLEIIVGSGIGVVTVSTVADALARLGDGDRYHAVLAHDAMPEGDVRRLVDRAMRWHHVPTLWLGSGHHAPSLPPGVIVVRKPVYRSALLEALRGAIGASRASQPA